MKLKRIMSFVVSTVLIASTCCAVLFTAKADAASNPNEATAAKYGIDAIRDSLNLVWSDEFGGDIGCGAEKEPLATTNGFDENGNPTSDEVRKNAKWAHERGSDYSPISRNNQLQLYVGEDGRNSWTEDGVLHLLGQREEGDGYLDPITKQRYRWTADGLSCSYFEDGKLYRQAFRFGMMEARIYTVNGVARVDENGTPYMMPTARFSRIPQQRRDYGTDSGLVAMLICPKNLARLIFTSLILAGRTTEKLTFAKHIILLLCLITTIIQQMKRFMTKTA